MRAVVLNTYMHEGAHRYMHTHTCRYMHAGVYVYMQLFRAFTDRHIQTHARTQTHTHTHSHTNTARTAIISNSYEDLRGILLNGGMRTCLEMKANFTIKLNENGKNVLARVSEVRYIKIYTYLCACVHTNVNRCEKVYIHTCIHTYIHTCMF